MNNLRRSLETKKHSPLRNYIVPGLTSWIISKNCTDGLVRMFEMEREQMEFIAPHSHRYNFRCHVLEGKVWNRKFYKFDGGDTWAEWIHAYQGTPGQYDVQSSGTYSYTYEEREYRAGDDYSMEAKEIHSIRFAKYTKVLFWERESDRSHSVLLTPHVNEVGTVPFPTPEPWMFK